MKIRVDEKQTSAEGNRLYCVWCIETEHKYCLLAVEMDSNAAGDYVCAEAASVVLPHVGK
jgi:hypothetical protein